MRGGDRGRGCERKQGQVKVSRQMGWWEEDRQVSAGQGEIKVGRNRNGNRKTVKR